MMHRQHDHAGAEPDALGRRGRPGKGKDWLQEGGRGRIGRVLRQDDVLAHPHVGKPELLGLNRGARDRLGRGLAADMRQMNTDLHDAPRVPYMSAAQMPGEHMLPRRRGARKRCYGETSWGDLQLYGMTNLALGEYRTFKQRSLNLLS